MATIIDRNKNKDGTRKTGKDGKPLPTNYYVVYRSPADGKQKWEPAGAKMSEAKAKKTEIEKQLIDGTYQELKKATFKEYAEMWFKNEVEPRLKNSTRVSYRGILDNYLIPHFGNYKLTNITTAAIKEFISKEHEEGQKQAHKLSPRSIQYHLVVLKAILKTACIDGYLKQNPAEYVKPPRQEKKETEVLTPQEIKQLFDAAQEPFKTFFMIAALTGLRRGEVLGLRWSDVDLEKRLIYVRQNVVMGVIDTPKSDTSRRVVGISDKLHAALLNLQFSAPQGSEFIFVDKEGKLYDAAHISRVQFHKAIKDAKITKKIRFHDLRHSFATLLKNQGVHRNDIQGVVGHSSATVTDIYMHLMPEVYSKIASTAEDAIFSE